MPQEQENIQGKFSEVFLCLQRRKFKNSDVFFLNKAGKPRSGAPWPKREKAPHCGALWAGGGRARPPPFILYYNRMGFIGPNPSRSGAGYAE
jgi:hypothetical protein